MTVYGYCLDFSEYWAACVSPKSYRRDAPVIAIKDAVQRHENSFAIRSEYVLIAGRKVRYLVDAPFSEERCDRFGLEVEGLMTLRWEGYEKCVYVASFGDTSCEQVRYWIVHVLLPIALQLTGEMWFLHTASVLFSERTIALTAPSGGGKSTLAAYLLREKKAVLGDDILAIETKENRLRIVGAYPYCRTYREAERLGEPFEPPQLTEKASLDTIVRLDLRDGDFTPLLTRLEGIEKFRAIHEMHFLKLDALDKRRFEMSRLIARQCRVYRLDIPRKSSRLAEVSALISRLGEEEKGVGNL